MDKLTKLNHGERKALETIVDGCDEIDGWGFHRPSLVMDDLVRELGNPHVVGGYLRDLIDKDLIEFDTIDDTIWVSPEVYEEVLGA